MTHVKLKAGTFTHRINECGLKISRTPEFDGAGTIWGWRERWDISARILNESADPTDIDAVITSIEAVYATELSYIALLHDDDSPTSHEIEVANTIGGIRVVVPPIFPTNGRSEYVTYRTYQVAVEMIVPKRTGSTLVYDLKESIDFKLGGAVYGFLEANEGPAVKQQIRTARPYYATQSGVITGVNAFVDIPDPIWPSDQLQPVQQTSSSGRKVGNANEGYILFATNYRYEFGSTSALIGNPTSW